MYAIVTYWKDNGDIIGNPFKEIFPVEVLSVVSEKYVASMTIHGLTFADFGGKS